MLRRLISLIQSPFALKTKRHFVLRIFIWVPCNLHTHKEGMVQFQELIIFQMIFEKTRSANHFP